MARKPGSVSIKAELQKLLNLTLKGEHNPLTDEIEADMPVGRKIALNMILKAVAEADAWLAMRIMEQLDGKPAQALNVGGQGEDNPVHIDSKLEVVLVASKGSGDVPSRRGV
jgi:hypothetical protein